MCVGGGVVDSRGFMRAPHSLALPQETAANETHANGELEPARNAQNAKQGVVGEKARRLEIFLPREYCQIIANSSCCAQRARRLHVRTSVVKDVR